METSRTQNYKVVLAVLRQMTLDPIFTKIGDTDKAAWVSTKNELWASLVDRLDESELESNMEKAKGEE